MPRGRSHRHLGVADQLDLQPGDRLVPPAGDQQRRRPRSASGRRSASPRPGGGGRTRSAESALVGQPGEDERACRARARRPRRAAAPRAAVASLSESVVIAASVGPMHGVQPSAEEEAEQRRRGQPDGRHLVDPPVALEERHQPAKARPSTIVSDAEHDARARGLPGRPARRRAAPDGAAEDDEDDREAEHEQQRAEEHPAAPGAGRCRRRGRRRTARSRRRGSRAAAGSRTARRTTPARRPAPPGWRAPSSRTAPCRGTSHPSVACSGRRRPRRGRPASASTGSRRGCWPRPGPRRRGRRCRDRARRQRAGKASSALPSGS